MFRPEPWFRCALLLALEASCFAHPSPANALDRELKLVPAPRTLRVLPGQAALGSAWVVVPASPEDALAAGLLVQEIADCFGWLWSIASTGCGPRVVRFVADSAGSTGALGREQGYRLDVRPDRIVIAGATSTARFYGVQTLRQILRGSPAGVVPCVSIRDQPTLRWRGISDDISRGQVSTLDDFKATVRQLAYYKVNLYQLYIEDMFVFRDTPTTGVSRGALTPETLREIVEEGRRHHVVVSPIFQTVAHQERFLGLADHDRFADHGQREVEKASSQPWDRLFQSVRTFLGRLVIAETGDRAVVASFSLHNRDTQRFVMGLVDELARVTGPPFFHIGGDEWTPPTAAASEYRAYGQHVGALVTHLRDRHRCQAMFYGDVILEHPEAAAGIPRDAMVVDWQYEPRDSFPTVQRLRALGFRNVMVSPALWTWRTFYPNYAKAFRNVRGLIVDGVRAGASGAVTASWGDGGAENLRENNWIGYAFGAAVAWEGTAPSDQEFLGRFVVAHYGVDAPALVRAEHAVGWQTFEHTPWTGVLFHKPFPVRPRPESSVARMRSLLEDMIRAESDLTAAAPHVRFNSGHMAALRHAISRYGFMARRELVLDSAGRLLQGRTAAQVPAADRRRLAAELASLEDEASVMGREFGVLWRRSNMPQGLDLNEARWARQAAMLRALRQSTERGDLRVDDSFSRLQALPYELRGNRWHSLRLPRQAGPAASH